MDLPLVVPRETRDLAIPLPVDARQTARLTVKTATPLDTDRQNYQIVGSLDGFPHSQVILTKWNGAVHTSLHVPGSPPLELAGRLGKPLRLTTHLRPAPCGTSEPADHSSESDTIAPLSESDGPTDSQSPPGQPPTAADPALALACAGAGSACVDVLVFYNEAARLAVGGDPARKEDSALIEAKILTAVAQYNTVCENSGIPIVMRLCAVLPIDYPYPPDEDFTRALHEMRDGEDGIIDEIVDARNRYGADIVSLWLDSDVTGGRAFIMRPDSKPRSAVHVVRARNPVFTFVHEAGHNHGCRHLPGEYDTPPSSWHPYSYANVFDGTDGNLYATIMTPNQVANDMGATRIPHFGNSQVLYQGTPTGIAEEAEAARSISESRFCVERYHPAARPRVSLTDASSPLTVGLEYGYVGREYVLQRSTDLKSWTSEGSVTTDLRGFAATPAPPTTARAQFYRWSQKQPAN